MKEPDFDLDTVSNLAEFDPDQIFEKQILTVKETARLLKFSPKTVYKMAHSRELPHKKVGREYRFLLAQLICWMKGE